MKFTELERKALLGDKEAQSECSDKLVILPCPKCFGDVSAEQVVAGQGEWKATFRCHECGLEVTEEQDYIFFEGKPIPTGKNPLEKWNDRGLAPIGLCMDCIHLRPELTERWFTEICSLTGKPMGKDEFCSRFKRR